MEVTEAKRRTVRSSGAELWRNGFFALAVDT